MTVLRVRKKPVEVQAMLYDGTVESAEAVIDWAAANGQPHIWTVADLPGLEIQTLEGMHRATPGDYVIRGVKGEFYPCKPDIFLATYDVVGWIPERNQEGGA